MMGMATVTPQKEGGENTEGEEDALESFIALSSDSSRNPNETSGIESGPQPAVSSSNALTANGGVISPEYLLSIITVDVFGFRCHCGAVLSENYLRKTLYKHFGANECRISARRF